LLLVVDTQEVQVIKLPMGNLGNKPDHHLEVQVVAAELQLVRTELVNLVVKVFLAKVFLVELVVLEEILRIQWVVEVVLVLLVEMVLFAVAQLMKLLVMVVLVYRLGLVVKEDKLVVVVVDGVEDWHFLQLESIKVHGVDGVAVATQAILVMTHLYKDKQVVMQILAVAQVMLMILVHFQQLMVDLV
jgi:hypothetical protein